jgi:hypothetical protein
MFLLAVHHVIQYDEDIFIDRLPYNPTQAKQGVATKKGSVALHTINNKTIYIMTNIMNMKIPYIMHYVSQKDKIDTKNKLYVIYYMVKPLNIE